VVGGGPAGATAAYLLSRAGKRVAILEKSQLPRPKTCAGGVNLRTAHLLDVDLSPVVECTVDRVEVNYRRQPSQARVASGSLTYMVTRRDFDKLLTVHAMYVGAKIIDKCRVERISQALDCVEVYSSKGLYRARAVIGADGAESIVAYDLGLIAGRNYNICLETEVVMPETELEMWRQTMALTAGRIPGGYSWIFPKRDHLSVGVMAPPACSGRLRSYLAETIAARGLSNYRTTLIKGARLPINSRRTKVLRGSCLLVGDAAGFTDAMTGEGIYYAVRSAQIAAFAIERYLNKEVPDLGAYQSAVNNEIMPDLGVTRALQRLFILMGKTAPWFLDRLFVSSDRAWSGLFDIVRGEESYSSIKKRLGLLSYIVDWLGQ